MPTGASRKHGGAQQGRWGEETNEEHPLAQVMMAAIQLQPTVDPLQADLWLSVKGQQPSTNVKSPQL